jgi:hypothetical protein
VSNLFAREKHTLTCEGRAEVQCNNVSVALCTDHPDFAFVVVHVKEDAKGYGMKSKWRVQNDLHQCKQKVDIIIFVACFLGYESYSNFVFSPLII